MLTPLPAHEHRTLRAALRAVLLAVPAEGSLAFVHLVADGHRLSVTGSDGYWLSRAEAPTALSTQLALAFPSARRLIENDKPLSLGLAGIVCEGQVLELHTGAIPLYERSFPAVDANRESISLDRKELLGALMAIGKRRRSSEQAWGTVELTCEADANNGPATDVDVELRLRQPRSIRRRLHSGGDVRLDTFEVAIPGRQLANALLGMARVERVRLSLWEDTSPLLIESVDRPRGMQYSAVINRCKA